MCKLICVCVPAYRVVIGWKLMAIHLRDWIGSGTKDIWMGTRDSHIKCAGNWVQIGAG